MDQLGAMRMFVEIVDRGSLSAAARRLQVSLPVVVRTLAALERRLGVRLLNRTTRRIHLTEVGAEFYQRSKRIAAEVEEAEQAVSAQRRTPTGTLVVNAPLLFGRMHVAPLIGTFLERYPEITVELTLSDRNVDIIEDGVDVAVRIGHLADSSLAATPLGFTQRVLVASPGYLRRHGTPVTLEDLGQHNCLRFEVLMPGRDWHFAQNGRDVSMPVSGSFSTNSGDAVIQTALEDRGIACVLYYQVMELVASGRLSLVLQQFAPPPVPIHAVFAHPKLVSAKVRAFVEHLKLSLDGRCLLPVQAQGEGTARPRKTTRRSAANPKSG